jgi:hypothetical protein
MGILKISGIVVAVAVCVLLVYASTRPDSFHVARSTTVQAPPAKLHALINDLHQFNTWNPFEKQDPGIRGDYSGPAAGPGAVYAFEGDKAGKGTVRITDSAPAQIAMDLHMLKPLEGLNKVVFTLAPRGSGTEVTWAMDGAKPFIAKLIGVFFDMDSMIGGMFENGLADLKLRAERA